MSYEPLHHKYRPQTFADLVGQDAIAQTLTNAIDQQKIAPAYLFTGPRGTGKTSSARILAKSLNCLANKVPTAKPCGQCDVCRGITKGITVDVIEIDAASNTGVDNIRDLIERSQFAPVQCRYKVYVIDECLTGDSLVQTNQGLMRIDNSDLEGKEVLSYNEITQTWEYKKVLRWLDQGDRPILTIKTNNTEIKCTGNHLIRTNQGWIPAKNLKVGMKILSSVNMGMIPSLNNRIKYTTALSLMPKQLENDWQNLKIMPSQQWHTNLEEIVSVKVDGLAKVYDIEVQDNHNFVANSLLVHNCHMLSTAAFNALLKTLEEPPERVIFVLATTDPQRVLPTIISRCQRFDFRRIPLNAMIAHLKHIAQQENINITDEGITTVAQISQGGLRDAESLLDQLSLSPEQVSVEQVWNLVGAVAEKDLLSMLEAIDTDNGETVLDIARHLMDKGREPLIVLQSLAGFYRDLLIAKTAPKRSDLVALTSGTWESLCRFAIKWSVPLILAGQKLLRESEYQIKNTTQPRLWLEITLLGLLPSALSTPTIVTTTQTQKVTPVSQIAPEKTPQVAPTPQAPIVEPKATPKAIETVKPAYDLAVSNQPMSQASSLAEIWETLINSDVVKPSTKGSLVNASLQQLDDQSALIFVKNSSMADILKKKVPTEIEPALEKILGRKVKVNLTLTPAPHQSPENISQDVATASVSVEVETTPDQTDTLKELWEQILQNVKSTVKTNLKKCGKLGSFDGEVVVIYISDQTILSVLKKNNTKDIQEAFQKVLGRKIQVNLDLIESADSQVASQEKKNLIPSNLSNSSEQVSPVSSSSRPAPTPSPNPVVTRTTKTNYQKVHKTEEQEKLDDEQVVMELANRIAKIFKGEIVDRISPVTSLASTEKSIHLSVLEDINIETEIPILPSNFFTDDDHYLDYEEDDQF